MRIVVVLPAPLDRESRPPRRAARKRNVVHRDQIAVTFESPLASITSVPRAESAEKSSTTVRTVRSSRLRFVGQPHHAQEPDS